MSSVDPVSTSVTDYSLADLEALENEHPELGRLEVIDGALHATGESAVGDLHQLVVQRLFLLFAVVCPPTHLVRLDTWWLSTRGKIRPDLAVYRAEDRPANRKAFTVAPYAIVEVLSDDAHHDLVRKEEIYAEFGVTRRAYVEPWARHDWWCRLDGRDVDEPQAVWDLSGWPPVQLQRDELLAD
jgi:Uma2 family endonuclease